MNEIETDIRIRFSDCDRNQNVYFSKYFMYFEIGRFEIADLVGLNEDYIIKEFYFPVIEATCNYLKPIHMNAEVILKTTLEKPIMSKLIFIHSLVNKTTKETYAEAVVVVAIVSYTKGLLFNLDSRLKYKILSYFKEGT